MKTLIISHSYAASYNRRDKLARIAKDPQVERLAVVVPQGWKDRMMGVARPYEKIAEDDLYEVKVLRPFLAGLQSRYFYNPLALLKIVREFGPDLIHVEQELHDWVLGEVILLNMLFWHKPISIFVWENLRRRYGRLTQFCRKFNLRRVKAVIGGNKEAVEIVREDGFRGSTAVIPQFGVDERRFRPMDVTDLRKELNHVRRGNLTDRFVVGFVGRFVGGKGLHTLISAVKLCKELNLTNLTLVLLSSMAPPEWLQRRVKDLGDRVKFIQSVPHEEFPRYMNLFDVLVLPSETQPDWKEQFGRVMIEAMACGVPVIGSSSGAIPEVIGEHGLIFEEKNAVDLAEKIGWMVERSQDVALRWDVRGYVLQNYTHSVVVEKTVSFWEEIVQEKTNM